MQLFMSTFYLTMSGDPFIIVLFGDPYEITNAIFSNYVKLACINLITIS